MYTLPTDPQKPTQNRRRRKRGVTISRFGIFMIFSIFLGLMGLLGWQYWRSLQSTSADQTDIPPIIEKTATPSNNDGAALSDAGTAMPGEGIKVVTVTPMPGQAQIFSGLIVISLSDGAYKHLFAYHPENFPLTRLTSGEWDDFEPEISPDGKQVLFSSQRGGQWDLYILDLTTGETEQITNDPAYESSPAWTSDGEWIAYEKYIDENLDIYIQPTTGDEDALRVTFDLGLDFQPSWKPGEQILAFTSNRGGANNIWLMDIEQIGEEDYLTQFTNNPGVDQSRPAWSPDGTQLAWILPYFGFESIFVADPEVGETSAAYIGSGSQAVWSP
ncbi:MAG: hypothetical protein N2D54_04880, partial [Chloroflexota bacterium]